MFRQMRHQLNRELDVKFASSLRRVGIQHGRRYVQPLSKQSLAYAIRVIAPTLIAFAFAGVAHAQGTMDFSGAQTLMGTFKTFAIYAGAVICFGGLIFAGIRMMSGRFQDAIPGLFGALFGAGVLGWGAGWIGYSQEYLDASSPRRQQIVEDVPAAGSAARRPRRLPRTTHAIRK